MRDKVGDGRNAAAAPRKHRRWHVWLGVLVALVVVSFAALEYTASPSFCASCHEIQPSVEGWRSSVHGEQEAATCMDCHADHGFVGEMVAHIGGLQEAQVHITQKPESEHISGSVPAERCVRCHDDEWADESFSADHPTKDAPCAVCHRDSSHTNEKPIYVPADKGGE